MLARFDLGQRVRDCDDRVLEMDLEIKAVRNDRDLQLEESLSENERKMSVPPS